jgi:hypothetical protein
MEPAGNWYNKNCKCCGLMILLIVSTVSFMVGIYYHNQYADYNYYAKLAVTGITVSLLNGINLVVCNRIKSATVDYDEASKKIIDTTSTVFIIVAYLTLGYLIEFGAFILSLLIMVVGICIYILARYIWLRNSIQLQVQVNNMQDPLLASTIFV